MSKPPPSKPSLAELLAALAENPDIPGILKRFGLEMETLQNLFREAAQHLRRQEQEIWTLFFDGASQGNPGPAGAGAVLLDGQGQIRVQLTKYLGRATNNVAEYHGLLLGLESALQLGVRRLQIFSDSELVVRQIRGSYRVRHPRLQPLYQTAKTLLQKLDSYDIAHVYRYQNCEADRLARDAIDVQSRADYNK